MTFCYILTTKSKFVRCKKLTTCSVLHEEFIIRNPLQFVSLRTESGGGGGGCSSSSSSSGSSSSSAVIVLLVVVVVITAVVVVVWWW